MRQKNIQLYIIPIIAISVFAVLLFGAGYAYFTAQLTMNVSNYEITMPQQTSLVCTKTDCNVTITPDMMTNTNINNTTAKGTSNCSVSCTCSGTQGATCNYNVTLFENGGQYIPSTGLGTNKEFTVKITNQAGCTIQNSSSTETQVNTLIDKIVANCTLTVPQGGSITSNVYAEFKWYNLNIDQTRHASEIYEYKLSTEKRQIIYRNTTASASIGDNISVLKSGYKTDRNNISQNYYLKHIVENNIITESYVCEKYTEGGVLKEVCLRGGNASYYGTYDGMSSTQVNSVTGATGNIKKLQSIQNYVTGTLNGLCYYSSSDSRCDDGSSLRLNAYSNGSVDAHGNSYGCYISSDGIAYCVYW